MTFSQTPIMNGVSEHVADIITIAIGHIPLTLQQPEAIVTIPIGCIAIIYQEIQPHGNGVLYMVPIIMLFNGVIPAAAGMIFMDIVMVPG